jgi:glycosyltransferase involved in cell wall biosynthesis
MKNIVIYGLSECLGGVEIIILSLLKYLSAKYNIIIVLANKDECQYLDKVPIGVSLVNVTAWGHNPSRFKSEFTSLLNSCNCDYVWINACVTSNAAIIRAITKANRPPKIIMHSHGTNYENDGFLKTLIIKSLHYHNRNLYNRVVNKKWACSVKAAEWFYGESNCTNVTIIRNGIDTDAFKYNVLARETLREQYHLGNSFVVLHIGRLSPVKNQSYLLRVFKELCALKSESVLIIAGTGELEAQLKKESEVLGIKDKVIFLGQYQNVSELYSLSDVFLLPSLHEGFPLTLVEAQCSGLTCFVSSSISSEVKLTDNLSFISNTVDPTVWAQTIATHDYSTNRLKSKERIVEAGYDIKNISRMVSNMIERS